MTPQKYPQNLHTQKILIFLKTRKKLNFKILNPKELSRLCMYENIRVPPPLPPPPPPETVCKNMTPNIIISSILTKSVMPLKRKAAVKSQQSPDPRARLSPVPSPLSCPVVSDDVQFNLQTSNFEISGHNP